MGAGNSLPPRTLGRSSGRGRRRRPPRGAAVRRPGTCGRTQRKRPPRCDPARVSDTAHPLLPPATPLLRDGDGAVQVGGVDADDGVLLDADRAGVVALLRGLDGRRAQRTVLGDAARDGLDPGDAAQVLEGLRAAGLLVDLDAADLLAAEAGPAAAARTASELPAALARPGGWRARRQSVVEGATRVGTPLAAMLAASGIGRVSVRDPGLVTAGDAVVGGLTAADEGRPR